MVFYPAEGRCKPGSRNAGKGTGSVRVSGCHNRACLQTSNSTTRSSNPMNAVIKNELTHDYKVADLSLADWGRKELDIAEHEMPGLM
jgi:hypothetical protein